MSDACLNHIFVIRARLKTRIPLSGETVYGTSSTTGMRDSQGTRVWQRPQP